MDQSHKLCIDYFFFFFLKKARKTGRHIKVLAPVCSGCSTPAGTNLLAFHTFPAAPVPPQPPPPLKKIKKMKRPLLRGNHSSVGLSAPRSLISCGTTSESTCRAAITQALGALGRRKMDLEGICGQSSPSLLCIRRHGTSTALVQVSSHPHLHLFCLPFICFVRRCAGWL